MGEATALGLLREAFMARVSPEPNTGCWLWMGAQDPHGYGFFYANGLSRRAHRYSLELHSGQPIPDGLFACHKCDNPPCINPDHLFLGTQADNIRDAMRKGRHGSQKQLGKKRGPYKKRQAA